MAKNSSTAIRPVNMVTLRMVRERKLGYNNPVTCSQDAIDLIHCVFQNSYREMVVVIGLDNSNRPTAVHTVALGSPDQAAVSVSSIFKPLLLSNSTGFVLVHNHPGDKLQPSLEDRKLTDRLKQLGEQLEIKMLDHIILNADGSGYYSFKTEGAM